MKLKLAITLAVTLAGTSVVPASAAVSRGAMEPLGFPTSSSADARDGAVAGFAAAGRLPGATAAPGREGAIPEFSGLALLLAATVCMASRRSPKERITRDEFGPDGLDPVG